MFIPALTGIAMTSMMRSLVLVLAMFSVFVFFVLLAGLVFFVLLLAIDRSFQFVLAMLLGPPTFPVLLVTRFFNS